MGDPGQLRRGDALSGGELVVLSGGLDSTVCLGVAAEAHPRERLVALTFDYGQRHRIELERATSIAAHYGADHLVVRLDASAWGGSALTDAAIDVPDADHSGGGIPVTYVPARNLVFLSVAVGVAEARDVDAVTIGVNALDYSGYPDCRPEFISSFASTAALALKRGVEGNPIEIRTPLLDLTKADIVRLGRSVRAPLELTWSCYRGDARPCGRCDACRLRAKGFAEAGLPDPSLVP
ncbi:MAG TPA: 7-cyano-7-deazaguanine synthase QueC [Acidimicrobiales bacterium]|nr:7-cyano-7-deazaguanine synthase QueC [Acidimicrobiales bacterium]